MRSKTALPPTVLSGEAKMACATRSLLYDHQPPPTPPLLAPPLIPLLSSSSAGMPESWAYNLHFQGPFLNLSIYHFSTPDLSITLFVSHNRAKRMREADDDLANHRDKTHTHLQRPDTDTVTCTGADSDKDVDTHAHGYGGLTHRNCADESGGTQEPAA